MYIQNFEEFGAQNDFFKIVKKILFLGDDLLKNFDMCKNEVGKLVNSANGKSVPM